MFALRIVATVFTALCLAMFLTIMRANETKVQKGIFLFLVITNVLNIIAMWG